MSRSATMPGSPDRPARPGGPAAEVLPAVGTLAAAVIAGGQFLAIYAAKGFASPIANDTLKYIWRSDLAAALGLDAIRRVPAGTTTNPDRPAFPVLASLLHAAAGTSAFRLAFVVSPVAAVLIGLAAGALAVDGLGEPAWSRPVYVLAVGGSVNVALMSLGYLDNLLVAEVVLACGTCALAVAEGRGGAVGASLLLAGAATIHWAFAAVFAVALAGLAVALVPESLRHRPERGLLRSPSARLLGIIGAGAAAGGALLLAAPSLPQRPLGSRGTFRKKLGIELPAYRFPVTGPLAAGGAAAAAMPPSSRRLRGLALLLVWALSAPAALLALHLGLAAPAHRLIAFALPIPVFVAALVVGLARAAGRLRAVGPVLGALAVLGGLAVSGLATHVAWFDRAHPVMEIYPLRTYLVTQEQAYAQAETAGAYVERYGRGRAVVFLIEPAPTGNSLALGVAATGIIRDALPPTQLPSTAFFIGRAQDLLAGRPTSLPRNPRFDRVALRFWAGVRELGPRPIVIQLAAFNPSPAMGGRAVAPGVVVLRGPTAPTPVAAARPPARPSTTSLALLVMGIVVGLAVVGSGWAGALVPGSWLAKASLSPALGLVVLAMAGLLADRAGLRLGGGWGLAVTGASAALGGGMFLLLKLRHAESPV